MKLQTELPKKPRKIRAKKLYTQAQLELEILRASGDYISRLDTKQKRIIELEQSTMEKNRELELFIARISMQKAEQDAWFFEVQDQINLGIECGKILDGETLITITHKNKKVEALCRRFHKFLCRQALPQMDQEHKDALKSIEDLLIERNYLKAENRRLSDSLDAKKIAKDKIKKIIDLIAIKIVHSWHKIKNIKTN